MRTHTHIAGLFCLSTPLCITFMLSASFRLELPSVCVLGDYTYMYMYMYMYMIVLSQRVCAFNNNYYDR